MTLRIPHSALRILAAFWRLNVAEELQYRANFVASVLGTVFNMATALFTLALFFHHTTTLGGWDYWEIVVLLGVFNALTGVIEAVLRPGIGQLAGEVRRGELDLVLVKPVDAQGFVSFRRLDIWRLTDVVLGLALAGYALFRMGHTPSLAQLAAFALTLATAAVVVYAIWVVLMSLAFWFVSVENIAVLFDAVYEGARYPVSAYPGALRFVFVYLIPIAWTTTIPASALTGRLRPEIALAAGDQQLGRHAGAPSGRKHPVLHRNGIGRDRLRARSGRRVRAARRAADGPARGHRCRARRRGAWHGTRERRRSDQALRRPAERTRGHNEGLPHPSHRPFYVPPRPGGLPPAPPHWPSGTGPRRESRRRRHGDWRYETGLGRRIVLPLVALLEEPDCEHHEAHNERDLERQHEEREQEERRDLPQGDASNAEGGELQERFGHGRLCRLKGMGSVRTK